jgi:hypothetical protein
MELVLTPAAVFPIAIGTANREVESTTFVCFTNCL